MKEQIFKTNIECMNCRARVGALLDKKENIREWSVDLEAPERWLTVLTDASAQEIIQTVGKAGFEAQLK